MLVNECYQWKSYLEIIFFKYRLKLSRVNTQLSVFTVISIFYIINCRFHLSSRLFTCCEYSREIVFVHENGKFWLENSDHRPLTCKKTGGNRFHYRAMRARPTLFRLPCNFEFATSTPGTTQTPCLRGGRIQRGRLRRLKPPPRKFQKNYTFFLKIRSIYWYALRS